MKDQAFMMFKTSVAAKINKKTEQQRQNGLRKVVAVDKNILGTIDECYKLKVAKAPENSSHWLEGTEFKMGSPPGRRVLCG